MEHLPSNHLPTELGQQMFKTKKLIKLFKQLKKDGYSGLSLGLIIDLIERDAR